MRWEGVCCALVCGLVLVGAVLPALGADECYEDVIVSGSGVAWANVRLQFYGMHDVYPSFGTSWTDGIHEYVVQLWYYAADDNWHLPAQVRIDPVTYCVAVYINDDVSSTVPPSTGWYLDFSAGCLCDGDGLPPPRVSGGEPCGLTDALTKLVPAGLAGFLDRGWPEGEEPPRVGELVVSATYEVGELITGCMSTESTGDPANPPYATLTWYAVTIGDQYFDVREPIDTRLLYDEDGTFCFAIPTEGLAPGYYDIRLGLPFLDEQWVRVEVVAPAE